MGAIEVVDSVGRVGAMRVAGLSCEEIADTLAIPVAEARAMVSEWTASRDAAAPTPESARLLELARLDALHELLWPFAVGEKALIDLGDGPRVVDMTRRQSRDGEPAPAPIYDKDAVDRVLKIHALRVKLTDALSPPTPTTPPTDADADSALAVRLMARLANGVSAMRRERAGGGVDEVIDVEAVPATPKPKKRAARKKPAKKKAASKKTTRKKAGRGGKDDA